MVAEPQVAVVAEPRRAAVVAEPLVAEPRRVAVVAATHHRQAKVGKRAAGCGGGPANKKRKVNYVLEAIKALNKTAKVKEESDDNDATHSHDDSANNPEV